jgi:hypothetical protein
MAGIMQVLPLQKSENNILKCNKKIRTPRGKMKDFLRMQNVAPKIRRNVLNARR